MFWLGFLIGAMGYILGAIVTTCFGRWVDGQVNKYGYSNINMGDEWYGYVALFWPLWIIGYPVIYACEVLPSNIKTPRLPTIPQSVKNVFATIGDLFAQMVKKIGKFTGKVCPN